MKRSIVIFFMKVPQSGLIRDESPFETQDVSYKVVTEFRPPRDFFLRRKLCSGDIHFLKYRGVVVEHGLADDFDGGEALAHKVVVELLEGERCPLLFL